MFKDSTSQYDLDDVDEQRLIADFTDYEQANKMLSQMQPRRDGSRQLDSSSSSPSRSASAVNPVSSFQGSTPLLQHPSLRLSCYSVADSKASGESAAVGPL